MKNKTELFREAKRLVAARRQNTIMRREELLRQLHAKQPLLTEADNAITNAGFEAARLAASGAGPARQAEAMKALKAAQAHRLDLIRQMGYSAEDLELKPTCPLCCDLGVKDGQVCSCVLDLCRTLRREEILQESSLNVSDFDAMQLHYYPDRMASELGMSIRNHMAEILSVLKEYAGEFDMNSSNLLLVGNSGLGKTHAALAIAGIVLQKGYDAIYTSSQDLFFHLEKARFDDDDTRMEAVLQADLLVLDDLGTEYGSPYVQSCLYDILNSRIGSGKPTIITSNIIDDELFYQKYTEKIASRLLGNFERIEFRGDDIRLIKQAE